MNSGKQVQHIKICGQNKECCTCMVVTAVVSSVANLPPLCVCVCVCVCGYVWQKAWFICSEICYSVGSWHCCTYTQYFLYSRAIAIPLVPVLCNIYSKLLFAVFLCLF